MQRFSVSVDDELAAWIEAKADELGVSKAKVIRDSVETAQSTGLIRSDDGEPVEAGSLIERIETLEAQMEALDSAPNHEGADEVGATGDDIVARFRTQLRGQPPTTEHGKKAVLRVFEELLEDGPLKSKELRERLYPEFETEFSSPNSMWQSTQRHFDDIDGIEKAGHGLWEADPKAVDAVEAADDQGYLDLEEFDQPNHQNTEN